MGALTASDIDAEFRGWLPHKPGAPCPVEPRALVKVRSAFEADFDDNQMPRRAGCWDWAGAGDLCDITHFKVVQ